MCECYQIGGRFIAEDPDCPVHGRGNLPSQIERLEAQVERLEAQRKQLREALLDLMAASGALNGNPASDNPHEAKARAALKATE